MVFGSAPILNQLAKDWVERGPDSAQTVVELQQAMHARELAAVTQPIQVVLSMTPPEGMAAAQTQPQLVYADPDGGLYAAEHVTQLLEAIEPVEAGHEVYHPD